MTNKERLIIGSWKIDDANFTINTPYNYLPNHDYQFTIPGWKDPIKGHWQIIEDTLCIRYEIEENIPEKFIIKELTESRLILSKVSNLSSSDTFRRAEN